MQKFAINVPTNIFYQTAKLLESLDFKLVCEYDPSLFDKSIDFDYLKFEKDNEIIEFVWDNWCEGEIKASEFSFNKIEQLLNIHFTYGNSDMFNGYKEHLLSTCIIHY